MVGSRKTRNAPQNHVKRILLKSVLGCLSLCGVVLGQSSALYVDFGSSSLRTASPDSAGRYWNNVTELTPSGLANLVSDTGQLTGISLGVTGTILVNPFGTTVPNAATLGGLAVSTATQDWFYVSDPNVITVTLGNLAPDGVYRLSLFGSRDSSTVMVTKFDVVGLSAEVRRLTTGGPGIGIAPQPNANRSDLSVIDNLSPDANGSLTISVRRDAGSFGYLGALRLETMNVVNSPPAANEVAIVGAPRVGENLLGRYSYWDMNGDPQSGTQFYWESAASPNSSPTALAAPSSSALNVSPTSSEVGKYLRLCVVPRASTGRSQGAVARSSWLGPIVPSETITTFHIGSSYTLWSNIPLQLSNLSNSFGKPLSAGGQITAGRDSLYHWNAGLGVGNFSGTAGTIYDVGTPSRLEIPTGSWDIVVMQPYNTEWQSWQRPKMYEYARRFYALADSNGSQFYLYGYWCKPTEPISTQDQINTVFEQVRAQISLGGAKKALIIPAGQALRAVIEQSGTGVLSGLDRASFYLGGDDHHPSNLGGYVSALTHYATIHKASPVGLPARTIDAGFNNDDVVQISSSVATKIQQIVWDVVRTYPNSGVTGPIEPVIIAPPPVYVTHPSTMDPALVAFAFGPSVDGVNAPRENLPHAVAAVTPGRLALEYSINPDAEAAQTTCTPEWSSDLINWTATQPAGFVQTRTGQKVTISWPRGDGAQFVRVYVVKPGS